MQERAKARFPGLAGALSFIFPGLGQAYARQPTMAVILAIPVAVLVAAGVLTAVLLPEQLRAALFRSQFLVALIALDLLLLAWRLFAIVHVGMSRPAGAAIGRDSSAGAVSAVLTQRRPWEVAVVALLVAATIGMHAWGALVLTNLDSALGQIFTGGPVYAGDVPTRGPLNHADYHWDGKTRISFLLLGIDSGAYRSSTNTDTILVVSIDPVRHTAVMISVPRDTGWLPLPDRRIYANGRYPNKINSLAAAAAQNPALWCPDLPASADCGIRTLERTIGLYLGIDINFYATLNLTGFADLINAIGGVRICVPGTLADPLYGGPTWYPRQGIVLQPGCQQMDGAHALAYARIRKGTLTLPDGTVQPQDDFKRAARQQEVLVALRDQFATPNWVLSLPSLLKAVAETVSTDFPREQAGNLASLLPVITAQHVQRVVLSLPDYVTLAPNPQVDYILIPNREAVRQEMLRLFGADGPLKGWYVGSGNLYPPS